MFNQLQLLIITSFILLSGCSVFQLKNADYVHTLLSNNQYDEAISVYNTLAAEEQNLVDIQQIKTDREQYEKNLTSNIQQLIKKNDYLTASQHYEKGLMAIPSSEALLKSGQNINQKKAIFIETNQHKYNLLRAKFLIDEKPILEKLMLAKGNDDDFITLYNKRQQERDTLAEELGLFGLKQFANKQFETANITLTLAQDLKPDNRWQVALTNMSNHQKKIATQQKEQQEKQKKLLERQQQIKVDAHKQEFEAAMATGDLPAAQQALMNINKMELTNNKWNATAKARLERTIQTSLELTLKQGQALYNQGDISQALNMWRAAQRYAPNDKRLNESIKRAATFEKNLLELATPSEE